MANKHSKFDSTRLAILAHRFEGVARKMSKTFLRTGRPGILNRVKDFAELSDGTGMGEVGAVIPPSVGVVSGRDPRAGLHYVNQFFLGMTGGAAGPLADAWLTVGHAGNVGLSCLDGVELDELYHPLIVESRELIPDTEGASRQIGAQSIRVEFGPIGAALEIGHVSDEHQNPLQGVRGGLAGGRADQKIQRLGGTEEGLEPCAQVVVAAGETIISIGAGGGGYGPPSEGDPALVAHAVQEGLLTLGRAEETYGVILKAGVVDAEVTIERRGVS